MVRCEALPHRCLRRRDREVGDSKTGQEKKTQQKTKNLLGCYQGRKHTSKSLKCKQSPTSSQHTQRSKLWFLLFPHVTRLVKTRRQTLRGKNRSKGVSIHHCDCLKGQIDGVCVCVCVCVCACYLMHSTKSARRARM